MVCISMGKQFEGEAEAAAATTTSTTASGNLVANVCKSFSYLCFFVVKNGF